MNLYAHGTDFGPDQAATSIGVPAVSDAHADVATGRVPAVQRPAQSHHGPRSSASLPPRWLRLTVAGTGLAVVIAVVALIASESSLFTSSPATTGPSIASNVPTTHRPHGGAFLVQSTQSASAATYTVSASSFTVLVTTGANRSWVSIGSPGQKPTFEQVLPADASHQVPASGAMTVEVGAGQTSVTVRSGKDTQTLEPPSAPFTYTLMPG